MTPDPSGFSFVHEQIRGLAAWEAGSPIVTTSRDPRRLDVTVVRALDAARNTEIWRRRVRGQTHPPRLTTSGTLWISQRNREGAVTMVELNDSGDPIAMMALENDPVEVLTAYVALPDGILALWLPAGPGRVLDLIRRQRLARWLPTEQGRSLLRRRHARLARHGRDGSTRWSTALPLQNISFAGVGHLGRGTGGEIRPHPPWTPRTLMSSRDPLLVSGSRVAATVVCGGSGIAVTFFVAVRTGQVLGTTAPGPSHLKAIAAPGEFLIGYQGYGDFHTEHHDATGAVLREWPSHAHMLVDADGAMTGLESRNTSAETHFVRFDPDGTVRRGPALGAYDTAYPALDRDGTAVFWRDGALRAVDADLHMRELVATRHGERALTSRVLLLNDGCVAFALNDELVIHREPGLGPLNEGVWPCGEGGLLGNPVAYLED